MRPVTVAVVAVALARVRLVVFTLSTHTSYSVRAVLPFAAGADHTRSTTALPYVAVLSVGASGATSGMTAAEASDTTPNPRAFFAVTRKT